MLRRTSILALGAAGLTACSLYVGDGSKKDATAGTDASIPGAVTDATPVPGDCSVTEEEAVAGLSSCMTYDEFEAAGLCDLAIMRTSEGACYNCHTNGMDGITLETDCSVTFEAMKTWPRQNDLVTARVGDDGCFAGFDVGRLCGMGLPEDHPPFVCPNQIAEDLANYIDSNLESWRAGACVPDGGV